MRRVLGWADARAYDATMTTEHSAAASVVVPSRVDHLCAQLEAPAGSAALVVPATAWRVRVITHFLVRSVALVKPLQNARLTLGQSGRTGRWEVRRSAHDG